ncbi:protein NEDD1-like [Ornithodoros turicata]|uniref:protein NEDD1-like n=1 Tax=Ornithodoros turicata TaxID=34597 RepID=UPI003139F0A3
MKQFRFATSGDDVRIWDATTLELQHNFYASASSKAPIIRWSHDGEQILAVPRSGDCVHLTWVRGQTLRHENVHVKESVSSATYATEVNRYLGIGCTSGNVLVWDMKRSKPRGTYQAPHKGAVTCVCFGAHDTILASGGADGNIVLNNVVVMSSFTELGAIPSTVMRQVSFSPLRRYTLLSASSEGRIDLWDAASKTHSHCFSGLHDDCKGIALSHINDSFFLSVGVEGNIGMYDLSTKRVQRSIAACEGLHSVSFLHDGIHFVVGGVSGQAYVYDLRQSVEPIVGAILAHAGPVTSICMQPLVTDEETGLSIGQQSASFTVRPKEIRAPMTLSSLIQVQGEGASAFSPANSTVPSSRRVSTSSQRLSLVSTDYPREGYDAFSPLTSAVDSKCLDDTNFSVPSHAGGPTPPGSGQMFSTPCGTTSVNGPKVVEEAPLSPIDSDCESVGADRGDFGKSSEHKQCGVPEFCLGKVTLRGDTMTEGSVNNSNENKEDAASPTSQDSGNSDPPPSNSEEAEEFRVKCMIQRFRGLYGLADDDSVLEAGQLAPIIRRVFRQELHDIKISLQAQHQAEMSALRDEILGELRSLREEIQDLKEF